VNVQDWTAALTDSVLRVFGAMFEYLPNLVGCLALLAVGWLVASLLRFAARHLTRRALDTLAHQRLARTRAIGTRTRQSRAYRLAPAVVGMIVFWIVLVFFLSAAIEALGLTAVSGVVSQVTAYLPRALAGVVIIFVGLWVGEFLRRLLGRAAGRADFVYGDAFARVAQWLVVVVFAVIAIDQLGIDSTIFVTTISVLFAVTLGAAALAFALGAKVVAGNIIASRYVRRSYHPGDHIQVAEFEGEVTDIDDTAVVLKTSRGQVRVPAARFLEEVCVLSKRGR